MVRDAMQREIATINPRPGLLPQLSPRPAVMVNGHAQTGLMADRAYAPPTGLDEDELLDTTEKTRPPPLNS